MPRRTNPFQRMILALETRLAPMGAEVRESVMLRDLGGTEREIDILVEVPVGIRKARFAIECHGKRRRADVGWIEQLHGKFSHLPVDRVTAVSQSGFTSAAKKKAAHFGIEAWTLEEATTADWGAAVREVHRVDVAMFKDEVVDLRVLFDESDQSIPGYLRTCDAADLKVTLASDTSQSGNLPQLIYGTMALPEAKGPRDAFFAAAPGGTFELIVNLHNWLCTDPQGVSRKINRATAKIRRFRHFAAVPLMQADYAGAAVAFGTGRLGDLGLEVTIAAPPDGDGAERVHINFTSLKNLPKP